MVEEMKDCGSYVMLIVGNNACACLHLFVMSQTPFAQTEQGIVSTCRTIIEYDSVLLHVCNLQTIDTLLAFGSFCIQQILEKLGCSSIALTQQARHTLAGS